MRTHSYMIEGTSNPFIDDVFLNHPDVLPGALSVHHGTFSAVADSVESLVHPSKHQSPADAIGRTILITAPRAGFGKTHLGARLKRHLQPSATTLTLSLDPSRPVSWPVAFSAFLRQFLNEKGRRSPGHCLFTESGHFLISQLILSHRHSGSLKPGQCPADDEALRAQFFSLFEPGSELLSWTDHQSRELTRRAESSFLQALGFSASELGFWTRLVIDFTLRGEAALEPLRGLSNGEARERMLQWLRIATFYRPVLIIADGLDGFFQSPTAGMEIAGLLTGIRESVPRSITLLTINEDVWNSVFQDKLPSAWLDRLTGETEKLRPISPEAATDLVKNRLERTRLTGAQRSKFIESLSTEHLWIDSETKLFPRAVIRQAREHWEKNAAAFFADREGEGQTPREGEGQTLEVQDGEEMEPLSSITDKVEFFEALAKDSAIPADEPTRGEILPGEALFPSHPAREEAGIENPFFAPPATEKRSGLVGIESIIADIRGTGKTVVSESADAIASPTPPPLPKNEPGQTLEAGLLNIRHGGSRNATGGTPVPLSQEPKPMSPPPEKKPDWMAKLKAREAALIQNPSLKLDLEKVELFIRKIGAGHQGLSQSEERFPSSRTVCVRWNVRGDSVLLGFESPQNVYFWNNLLQQSLASNRREKLAAFSHPSERFDPELFSGFGFSPAVTRGRIDIIEMNDRELAMIYAADSIIAESTGSDEETAVVQMVIRYLDPLWRRISQPIRG